VSRRKSGQWTSYCRRFLACWTRSRRRFRAGAPAENLDRSGGKVRFLPHRPSRARRIRHGDAGACACGRADGCCLSRRSLGGRDREAADQSAIGHSRQPRARENVVPEFLQEDCVPQRLAESLVPLIEDSPARRRQLEALPGSTPSWRSAPPSRARERRISCSASLSARRRPDQGRTIPPRHRHVVPAHGAGIELARTTDFLVRVLDHFLPLGDPADGARKREQHGEHGGRKTHRLSVIPE